MNLAVDHDLSEYRIVADLEALKADVGESVVVVGHDARVFFVSRSSAAGDRRLNAGRMAVWRAPSRDVYLFFSTEDVRNVVQVGFCEFTFERRLTWPLLQRLPLNYSINYLLTIRSRKT